MKALTALLATGAYLALLCGVYWIHVTYLPVDVVLYSAVTDAMIAIVVVAAILLPLGALRRLNGFEKAQLLVIWMLVGYGLAISGPAVLDRSLSFYILEKLQQRGGGIKLAAFEQVFTKEYVKEHRLVDVRLTEQLASGTVEIVDGCVRLTPKGERLVTFSRAFRRYLLPRHRLLMGQYSDALVDPFRDGVDPPSAYQCK